MANKARSGSGSGLRTSEEIPTYQIALCSNREDPSVRHLTKPWAVLAKRLARVVRTAERYADYLTMSKDEQSAIKDVGAYVAGSFRGFKRRKENQVDRTLLTLDIDEPGVPWVMLRAAIRGEFAGLQYAAHTTHKHCEQCPRVRVVLPLSRPVNDLEYQALCRQVAHGLDPSMVWVDRCSYDFTRLMYWPSASVDGQFVAWDNDGAVLDVDKSLARYFNWQDPGEWPRRQDEDAHVAQMQREDPRQKVGLIGLFCRLYPIDRVLDELLPGVYEPTENPDRYTFAEGTTHGGARMYQTPDGFNAFLHSEHDSDPARGQHTAWDVLRLHKGFNTIELDAFVASLPDVKQHLVDAPGQEFDAIEDAPEDPDQPVYSRYGWLENWVFCARDDKFFDTQRRGGLVGRSAFNGLFDRHAIKAQGSDKNGLALVHAVDIALQLRPIPTVETTMYWPGQTALFVYDGQTYANSYRDLRPAPISRANSRAVQLLQVHLENLFPDDADSQDMLLDFMAHIVRFPEQRPRYALLIRGAETDGKTYFAEVMRLLLGTQNWMTVGNDAIKEQYSAWLEGHLLVCIEEIKQHGQDAQDALNRLKPFITNPIVGVRAMRQDIKSTRAFAAFFLTTNYADAIPLDDSDSRYLILSTRFTHKDDVDAWAEGWAARHDGKRFFDELYNSLNGDGPGELRAWLDARPFSQHYHPGLRAPNTLAKRLMVEALQNEADVLLAELLESGAVPSICKDFIVLADFREQAAINGEPLSANFSGQKVRQFMLRKGYQKSIKVRVLDKTVNVWVRDLNWLDKTTLKLTDIALEKIKKAAMKARKITRL